MKSLLSLFAGALLLASTAAFAQGGPHSGCDRVGRRSDRRSDPARPAGASPQDRGWEACGGKAVHEPCRHHSELIGRARMTAI